MAASVYLAPLRSQLVRAPPQLFVRSLSSSQITRKPESSNPSTTLAGSAPSSSFVELKPLSYFVHRTPSQQLPVYHTRKRGGNLLQTRIQKITGKVEDLKKDLQEALSIEDAKIAINPVNRHIVIKGWIKKDVAAFLEKQLF